MAAAVMAIAAVAMATAAVVIATGAAALARAVLCAAARAVGSAAPNTSLTTAIRSAPAAITCGAFSSEMPPMACLLPMSVWPRRPGDAYRCPRKRAC